MRAFLDIDGVLADFVGGVCQHFSVPDPYILPENKGKWDVPKLLGIDPFWPMIGESFWQELKPMHDAQKIMALVCSSFEQVCLLSSPTRDSSSLSGKHTWVKKHYPNFQYLFGRGKYFCAHDEAVLIDDYDKNIDEFEAHGGHGILIPRPWNSLHQLSGNVTQHLENEIFQLTGIMACNKCGNSHLIRRKCESK